MTKLSDEDIEKIREEARTMKSRYEIAREFGVCHTVIYRYTADIPTPRERQPYIRGKCLEVLKKYYLMDTFIQEKMVMKSENFNIFFQQ